MVKSMTGFGRSQVEEQGYRVTCEIRGVNHRFLDPYIRISRRYNMLEDRIKSEIKNHVTRGRLEITINIDKSGESRRNIKVDKDLAIAYHYYLKELAENLAIKPEIKIIDLFRLPEVVSLEDQEEDLDLVWSVLHKCLQESLDGLVEMRTREGFNLAADIGKRNEAILEMVTRIETRSPDVARDYEEKLRNRIMEFIAAEKLDEARLCQEVAIFADKASVTEELVRLKSHIQALDEMMSSDEAIGRKCDFLVQEMFREINTIASKANDLEMNRTVVEVKAELEKIREQLQNIE